MVKILVYIALSLFQIFILSLRIKQEGVFVVIIKIHQ